METTTTVFGIVRPYIDRYVDAYDQTNFSFGLNTYCRNMFICFTQVVEPYHYFDFIKHPIRLNGLYYIPSNHHYLLPYHPETKFVAYGFPWFWHPSFCKWALITKYAPEKFICKSKLKPLEFSADSKSVIAQLEWFLNRLQVPKFNDLEEYYLQQKALQFLDVIYEVRLNYENCNVPYFANKLNICDRQFQRMCVGVFQKKPREIIAHHLLNNMAFEVLNTPYKKLNELADEFCFEHESGFVRFFKNGFNITPTEMRRMLPPEVLKDTNSSI